MDWFDQYRYCVAKYERLAFLCGWFRYVARDEGLADLMAKAACVFRQRADDLAAD